jgi:hypothetical protein
MMKDEKALSSAALPSRDREGAVALPFGHQPFAKHIRWAYLMEPFEQASFSRTHGLGLFTNFDAISFRVSDLEVPRAAAVMNWTSHADSARQVIVRLLHISAKHHGMIISAVVPGSLDLRPVAQQDVRLIGSRQL